MTTPRRGLRAALFLVALPSPPGSAAHAALDDRGFIDSFLPIAASVRGAQQADWYRRPNLTASTPRVADSLASGVRPRPWTLTAGH